MSDQLVAALIGFAGSILGGLIQGIVQPPKEGQGFLRQLLPGIVVGFLVGLLVGVLWSQVGKEPPMSSDDEVLLDIPAPPSSAHQESIGVDNETSPNGLIPSPSAVQKPPNPTPTHAVLCPSISAFDGLITDWENPDAIELQIKIPEGCDFVWISSDPATFNGFYVPTRVVIYSRVDVIVKNVSFNSEDSHFNIWAIAFSDKTPEEMFNDPQYIDGVSRLLVIDEDGVITDYAP